MGGGEQPPSVAVDIKPRPSTRTRADAETLIESLQHIQRVAAKIIAGITADEVATV